MQKLKYLFFISSFIVISRAETCECKSPCINYFLYDIPARGELFLKAIVPPENIYYRNAMADRSIFCILKVLYYKYPEAYYEILYNTDISQYLIEIEDPNSQIGIQ